MHKIIQNIIAYTIVCGSIVITTIAQQGHAAELSISSSLIKTQAIANERFTPVNFIGPGNDFGGGIIWLTNKKLEKPVKLENSDIRCSSQIRGFYFNSQRGERLWPLDEDTRVDFATETNGYKGLQIKGGWYTDCESKSLIDQKNFVQYSIFGSIEYTFSSINYFLIAGVAMDYDRNTIINRRNHSFQYLNNKTPVGYIYDNAGGIGFVGGRVATNIDSVLGSDSRKQHKNLVSSLANPNILPTQDKPTNINKAVKQTSSTAISLFGKDVFGYQYAGAQNSRLGFSVLGNIGVGKAYTDQTKRAILGNPGSQSNISEIASVNAANRFNKARKNGQRLYRGSDGQREIYYYDGKNAPAVLDLSRETINSKPINGRSVYIKDSDLIVKGGSSSHSSAIDIFVDGGDVILENKASNRIGFDAAGFPDPLSLKPSTQGLFYKFNLLVNGELKTNPTPINHRVFIHGKVVTLNTISTPHENRDNRLGTGDNLGSIFARRCNPRTGKGQDNAHCDNDQFALVPLVIIDQNYPSRFLVE